MKLRRRRLPVMIPALLGLLACGGPRDSVVDRTSDERFADVQERGEAVMGVDQYTSAHVFEDLADGGRIELQRSVEDSAGVAQIRRHMQEIRTAFAAGDFRLPGEVHDVTVPGTEVMARERQVIEYEYQPLPRGGELRIRTTSPVALAAIHEFLAFQRMDHRAHGEH